MMKNRLVAKAFRRLYGATATVAATVATTAAVTLAPVGAQAQGTVYRCGDSYSQQPCPGGIVVPAEDARSAQQKAQADAATRRNAQAAETLEKERLQQEARPPALSILPAPAASAPAQPEPGRQVVKKKKKHKKEPAYFTAVVPGKPGNKPAGKKNEKKAEGAKLAK